MERREEREERMRENERERERWRTARMPRNALPMHERLANGMNNLQCLATGTGTVIVMSMAAYLNDYKFPGP